MKLKQLTGIIPAVPTPLTTALNPDISRLTEYCSELLEQGAHGLNITGTTGEATSLSVEQRKAIIKGISDSAIPNDKVMFGTGAAAVADAEELTEFVGIQGFSRALVLPPFYFKDPTEDGLVSYFEKVTRAADNGNVAIYLYNFPALSGIKFETKLITRLKAEFGDAIVGLKDSSGDLDYAQSVAEEFRDMAIYPSNEAVLIDARNGKFAGSISATASLSARHCARAFDEGDPVALDRAVRVRKLIAAGALVPRIKATLSIVTASSDWGRVLPPYSEIENGAAQDLARQVQELTNS